VSDAVTVTVVFDIKDGSKDQFVTIVQKMFVSLPEHKGFRNNRLLQSPGDRNRFLMIEDWDTAQDFYDYVEFRTIRGEMEVLSEMTVGPPEIVTWAIEPLAAVQA
jgi:quinol monooxygenase YgiN